MKKSCVFAVVCTATVGVMGATFYSVVPSVGERNLAMQELRSISGRVACPDCDSEYFVGCNQSGCPTAVQGSRPFWASCPLSGDYGTGLSYRPACKINCYAYGNCYDDTYEPRTLCYESYTCDPSGSATEHCENVNGHCQYVEGSTEWCVNCSKGGSTGYAYQHYEGNKVCHS
jgi:hypothetical protein